MAMNNSAEVIAALAFGRLSDKLGKGRDIDQGGAIVTHWGTVIEIVATVFVGMFIRLASKIPQTAWWL